MNIDLEYPGTVEKGRFVPIDANGFRLAFPMFEGKEIVVRIYKKTKRRTDPQRKYYFGVVVAMIAEAIGERDLAAVHDMLKTKFNSKIIVIGEKEILLPQSTAKLSTEEFTVYIETCREFAAEFLNVVIPDPVIDMEIVK